MLEYEGIDISIILAPEVMILFAEMYLEVHPKVWQMPLLPGNRCCCSTFVPYNLASDANILAGAANIGTDITNISVIPDIC